MLFDYSEQTTRTNPAGNNLTSNLCFMCSRAASRFSHTDDGSSSKDDEATTFDVGMLQPEAALMQMWERNFNADTLVAPGMSKLSFVAMTNMRDRPFQLNSLTVTWSKLKNKELQYHKLKIRFPLTFVMS